MSLATFKKKTQATYRNASVGQAQFSINGVHRLQGYVGQTSLSRCLPKTLQRGNDLRGPAYAGVKPQDTWTTEDSKTVKSSVLSQYGMMQNRYRWIRRPQPFSSWKPDSVELLTSEAYTRHKKKAAIQENVNVVKPIIDGCSGCQIHKNEIANTRQSEYIENLCTYTSDISCQPMPRKLSLSRIPLPGN